MSHDFADDDEDLDIDAIDEEVSSKKDTDCEGPFDDLISSEKLKYKEAIDHKQDDLQYWYRHLRKGLRSVKLEVYTVIQILQIKYHLSYAQAEGAIATVGNELFGREVIGE